MLVFGAVVGLPAHVLLVHAVVVLVPLTAVAAVGCAVFPPLRRRFGVLLPLLAAVSLVLVPVTTQAGEWLEGRVPASVEVQVHTRLGDGLLPWVAGLFMVSAGVWFAYRLPASPLADGQARRRGGPALRIVLIVLAVVMAVGSVAQTYRIGESGARAAWQGRFTSNATVHAGGDD